MIPVQTHPFGYQEICKQLSLKNSNNRCEDKINIYKIDEEKVRRMK